MQVSHKELRVIISEAFYFLPFQVFPHASPVQYTTLPTTNWLGPETFPLLISSVSVRRHTQPPATQGSALLASVATTRIQKTSVLSCL